MKRGLFREIEGINFLQNKLSSMGLIRSAIGLVLIFLAWFNPLSLGLPIQIMLFIIGFDATGSALKVLLFLFNLLFPLLGEAGNFLTWTLLLLVVGELVMSSLKMASLVRMVKPLIVFATVFLGMGNFQLAMIVAGIDLILNLKR